MRDRLTGPLTRTTPESVGGPNVGNIERFLPGTIVAGRYRIRGRIGVGGMGEVYHADDLRLGQGVALKFLSARSSADPVLLKLLASEVRLARQVSHPNVCRVYDIGEVDGHSFLTMEFIDGENLASLLSRVGRLPAPKLVELAHQLCAGLAAAHQCGILHRDLKPGNVMVDGRGIARITDFGIAISENDPEAGAAEAIAGTPAYMAPEQRRGERLTPATDLYALGLILYETATGERHPEAPGASIALPVIDAGLEKGILWCLQPDPVHRPPSPLAVSALLPGGNLLTATLRAGATPSPELVAASGETGGFKRAVAGTLLTAAVAGLAAVVWLSGTADIVNRVPLPKPPTVLIDRARENLATLAPRVSKLHDAYDYGYHETSLEDFAAKREGARYWSTLPDHRPSPIVFWYRTSPQVIAPPDLIGNVQEEFPPLNLAGMSLVVLDPEGLLLRLRTVPDASALAESTASVPWAALLTAAGLSPDSMREVEPIGTPAGYATERRAWVGRWPNSARQPVRVEASALAGQPVDFVVGSPDSIAKPYSMPLSAKSIGVGFIIELSLYIVALLVGGWLAWRNYRLGRMDRRGATRLAGLLAGLSFLGWVAGGPHAPTLNVEWNAMQAALAESLRLAVVVWVPYVALEPFVRRKIPQCLISWNRVLSGRFLDALVGRDLLVGAIFGELFIMIFFLDKTLPEWLGLPPVSHPVMPYLMSFHGLGPKLFLVSDMLTHGVTLSMAYLSVLLGLLIVLRRWSLAGVAFVTVYAAAYALRGGSPFSLSLGLSVVGVTLLVILLSRFGLVASATAIAIASACEAIPIVSNLSAWNAGSTQVFALLILAPAIYGAWLCWRRPGRDRAAFEAKAAAA